MPPLRSSAPSGWQMGRLAGVPVYLGRSWVVVGAVIVFLFGPVAQNVMPGLGSWAYVVAGVFALLLLVSVLVHEAAHALVGQACGYRVNRIVADFWGGHTAYDSSDATPGRSALVAVAGPLANGALAGVGWVAIQAIEPGIVALLLAGFTYANAFVAAFNLLPGLPLDGGFLVDAAVWRITGSRATGMLVAGWCGRLLTLALVWWAIVLPIMAGGRPSLTGVVYALLIGSFLWLGASEAVNVGRARRRLEKVKVADLMRGAVVVPLDTLLGRLPFVSPGQVIIATGPQGQPVGLVDPDALSRVPTAVRGSTPVHAVVQQQPPGWVVTAEPSDALTEVVIAMQTEQVPAIAVRGRDGRLHGVVLAADLS